MKKILIIFLSLIMLTACNNNSAPEPENEPLLQTGDITEFGGYDWRVLDIEDGRALLLSEKVLENRAYHNEDTDITWADSDLRAYLNGEFYENFSAEEKARIIETAVISDDNSEYGTSGGENTVDRIFLLSIDEADRYLEDIDSQIIQSEEGWVSYWWLRSPGYSSDMSATVLMGNDSTDNIDVFGVGVNAPNGVRPALWIEWK